MTKSRRPERIALTSGSVDDQKDTNAAHSAAARMTSSQQIAKRAAAISLREKMEARERLDCERAITRARESDAQRFADTYGTFEDPTKHLDPDSGAAFSDLGPNVDALDTIVGFDPITGMYECKWLGFKHTTMEPSSNLQAHQVKAFEEAEARGETCPSLYELDRIVPPSNTIPPDAITLTSLEFAKMVKQSKCRTLKVAQSGEPMRGHRRTAAGTMAWNADCGVPLQHEWMINSETTSQVIHGHVKMAREAPEFWATRSGTAMDDNCHVRKQIEAVFRKLPEHSPVKEIFEQLATMPHVIDKFHFPNHRKSDTYCQENCNPYLECFEESLKHANTEVAEQTFRWLSRLVYVLKNQAIPKATFFQATMFWSHAERVIYDHCNSFIITPDARVAELRAMYNIQPAGKGGREAREELAKHLLAGRSRWDRGKLHAWQVHVAANSGSKKQKVAK